jgi:hypothetical protein
MMKLIFIIFIAGWLIPVQPALAQETDYTNRAYTTHACELFAGDAYHAADNYSRGVVLADLLDLMNTSPVSSTRKNRAFQAIQFVWKNQLDNPVLAYTLAMGLCLKPRDKMAPIDEPWVVSPRTIGGHY